MCDPELIRNDMFKTIVAKRLKIIMDQQSCPSLPNVRMYTSTTVGWNLEFQLTKYMREEF
jgi:hypothetical protein